MYDREVVHNQHDSMIKEINELQAKNQELEAQVGQMRKALEIIANPIKYLREVAEKQGRRLDCNVTFKLADSANYLSGIAEIALQTTAPARWEAMCRVVEAAKELFRYHTWTLEDQGEADLIELEEALKFLEGVNAK